jgi:carboxyl-terminal processing protease
MRKFLLIGISTFALGAAAMAAAEQQFASKDETYRMLNLFGDVLTAVDQQYVVPVDNKKLIQAALDGMLTSLDPHSGYLNPEGFGELSDQTRGDYGGLGIQVGGEEGAVKIIAPMDGTPASRAHLQAGDFITAIDGQSIIGATLTDAVKQMRGPVGSTTTLTIARDKADPFTVKLTREVINVRSVSRQMLGDYGYVRLAGFDEKTGQETGAAIKALKAENPKLKGLILDLRNNPGGLVNQAVAVSSDFLDGGEVVSQRGRDPRDIQRYNARSAGDMLKGLPVVVLVNNGTASAAEIVAGALKDRERASIVGLTTFGKGSVQSVIPLRDGKDGALKLTTAKYYTPAGISIQKTGITPDLQVAYSHRQAEAVYDDALQFSEASLKGALDTQEGKSRKAPAIIEVPAAAVDPVKIAEAKAAAKKAKEAAAKDLAKTDEAKAETPSVPLDGDDDIPQVANTGMSHLNPKTDFQLARALDVLKAGSVAAAVKLYPAETYAQTKPKFTTASIAPATGAAAAAGKAVATPAKPATSKNKTR